MHKTTKKWLSIFLSAAMALSLCSVPALAEEETPDNKQEIIETEQIPEEIPDIENGGTAAEEITDKETEQAEENTEPPEETAGSDTAQIEEGAEMESEEISDPIQLMSTGISVMSTSLSGDGTAENPYLITTEEDLLALANEELTNALGANYELQNDITVTSTTWVPIGNNKDFSGHFDGNGYTISGIILEGSGYTYTGFFGKNSGLIENLTVDVTFSASNYLGGLVAYNTGTISNCLTTGAVTSTSSYVGGLVGENYNGTIKMSGSTATVTGNSYVGGLVGRNSSYHGNASIINCYAQGNVTGSGSSVGGLVGYNYNQSSGNPVIRNCYASGKVNDGTGAGLVGSNSGRVYNSYYRSINTGNMTGYSVSTTGMKTQSTFYMWDFDNIWEINGSYPYVNVRGESEAVSFNGAGTETNPYLIETEDQLFQLSNSSTYMNNNAVYFTLNNNITITAKFWTPIGEYDNFTGVFDGNGYTISGVKNTGTDYNYIGLFGQNNGTIKNLTVIGDVSGQSNVGILTGYNSGTIENCLTKGTVNGTSSYAGGLVGENYNGTIKTSGSTATVTGNSYVGGLVGRNSSYHGNASIINCYAQGNVTGSGSSVGGLVGYNYNQSSGNPVIRNCYASGKVNDGTGAGLIGSNGGRVYNSYYRSLNTGNMTGYSVSTTGMKDQSTFYMWDFDNIWEINGSYPYINVRGVTPEIEFDGDGDVEEPYYVETEEQLYALAMGEAKTGVKIYYQLVNDITITAKFWTPIGEYDNFIGVFDGNGYTISGVKNTGTDYNYIGLFGQNNGTIKNLTVIGDVSGQSNVGILTGYNSGTIENCLTKGTVNGTSSYAGGLVGENYNGTIKTSGSTATVTGNSYVGGLVGRNSSYHGNASIINCYAQGNVTGSGSSVGGLVGYNYNQSSGNPVIRNCYASGKVNDGTGAGLVGSNGGRVYNSYYNYANIGNKTGFSTPESDLTDQNTYYMWDFDNIWEINGSYPYINVRGVTPEIEFDGDGDVEEPYYVETEEQLYALAMGEAKTGVKIYYQLVNDITITAKFWTPIGEYDNFIGVFDGNGYTISGVKNTGTDYNYIGLFGQNNGTIKNLTVIGDVSGQSNVGILTGYNSGTIENCLTKGTVNGTSSYAGGLVGENYNGTIKTSGSTATVTGKSYVGGLVGCNHAYNGNPSTTNCYAQGNVTGSGSSVGGLVGYNYNQSSGNPVIQYCYSIGVVSGKSSVGGIVGSNSGTVTASYYNSETSTCTDTVKGTPVSTDDMKIADTYAGWDFGNTWAMSSSIYEGYPYLQTMIPVEAIAVTGAALNKSTLSLIEGKSEVLNAVVSPSNATNKTVVWTSSNTAVATVSNGRVTAKASGTATITATTADGGYTASCVVTVTPENTDVSVTGVTLNKSSVRLEQGKTETLTATVSPSNATNKAVTWTSSDTVVATVSQNGVVTAKAAGTARITATSADGGYTAYCDVTVVLTENTIVSNGIQLEYDADNSTETSKVIKAYYVGVDNVAAAIVFLELSIDTATDASVVSPFANGLTLNKNKLAEGKLNLSWSDVEGRSNSDKLFATYTITVPEGTGEFTVTEAKVELTTGDFDEIKNSNGSADLCRVIIPAWTTEPTPKPENAPTITINDIKTMPGKDIQVTVDLSKNTGFANLGIEVGYNKDIMTLTGVKSNSGIGGTFTRSQDFTADPFNMSWDSASNITYNGNMATLTFTVGNDVPDGIYPITVDYYKGRNGNYTDGVNVNYDENFEAVGFVYINGNVVVASYIPGDINGDESVDNKDATYLLRYLAGWSLSGIVEDALDTDGSTVVDNKDATILLRYLAGWDVVLH